MRNYILCNQVTEQQQQLINHIGFQVTPPYLSLSAGLYANLEKTNSFFNKIYNKKDKSFYCFFEDFLELKKYYPNIQKFGKVKFLHQEIPGETIDGHKLLTSLYEEPIQNEFCSIFLKNKIMAVCLVSASIIFSVLYVCQIAIPFKDQGLQNSVIELDSKFIILEEKIDSLAKSDSIYFKKTSSIQQDIQPTLSNIQQKMVEITDGWSYLDPFAAVVAILIGIVIWYNEKKERYEDNLPSVMDVYYFCDNQPVLICLDVSVSTATDMRALAYSTYQVYNNATKGSFLPYREQYPAENVKVKTITRKYFLKLYFSDYTGKFAIVKSKLPTEGSWTIPTT